MPKVIAQYLPNWLGYPVRLQDYPSWINVLYIFHSVPAGGGRVSFTPPSGSYYTDAQATRQNGRKLIMTIGGANAGLHFNNRNESQNFVNSFVEIYNRFGGLDGIDWNNFEAHVQPSTAEMIWISAELKRRYGNNFLITAPPAPWRQADKDMAVAMVRAGVLDWVGPQLYDGPGQEVISNLTSRMDEWIGLLGPEHVVMGFGIANAPNYWNVNNAVAGSRQVLQRHPNIRGAFNWQLETDRSMGYPFRQVADVLGIGNLGGGSTPTPQSQPAPSTSSNGKYTVVAGDDYIIIARKLGIQNNLEALNPGVNPRNLQIGQVINVPSTRPTTSSVLTSAPLPVPVPVPVPVPTPTPVPQAPAPIQSTVSPNLNINDLLNISDRIKVSDIRKLRTESINQKPPQSNPLSSFFK